MRLQGLPYRFYNKKLLRIIVGTLRKVVTIARRRGKFARFALVVDLGKPLQAFVGLNGTPYCVVYEGLPSICFRSGFYGHMKDRCPLEVSDKDLAQKSAMKLV